MDLGERAEAVKFLIRDRDTKFTGAFDAIFTSIGGRIINTPVQVPKANAIAERWVGTVRRECTDRLLILGERHLHHVLSEYTDHYNQHRPHRTLDNVPPGGRPISGAGGSSHVLRCDRLGGLIHEYKQVA
jgi:transposase InsO family protein